MGSRSLDFKSNQNSLNRRKDILPLPAGSKSNHSRKDLKKGAMQGGTTRMSTPTLKTPHGRRAQKLSQGPSSKPGLNVVPILKSGLKERTAPGHPFRVK